MLNLFIEKPNIKNVDDIPNIKNRVFFNNIEFLNLKFLLKLSTLLLESIPMYTGSIGNTQGENKDITPSKNTNTKLSLSIHFLLNVFKIKYQM
ncbi:hypothetical protein D3C81_1462180 [compost metagenome]